MLIPDVGLRVGSKLGDVVVIIKQKLPVLNMWLSCAVWEQLRQSSLKSEQNWMASSLQLFVLSFQLNSCANSWGIIPDLELMRYIIIAALQPRQLETLYLRFWKQTVIAQNSTETNLSCFLIGYINPYKPPCFQHFTGFQYPNELISSCSDSTTSAAAMQQLVALNKYSNQGWY